MLLLTLPPQACMHTLPHIPPSPARYFHVTVCTLDRQGSCSCLSELGAAAAAAVRPGKHSASSLETPLAMAHVLLCRASDIWACGVILYQLLTCKLPFEVTLVHPLAGSRP